MTDFTYIHEIMCRHLHTYSEFCDRVKVNSFISVQFSMGTNAIQHRISIGLHQVCDKHFNYVLSQGLVQYFDLWVWE